jgi:FkbM family methyltransferase
MKSLIRKIAMNVSPSLVRSFKKKRARHDSFSQFGEDVVLWNMLKCKSHGFYLDCGAFDPYIYSNTARFYDAGWTGINIEPQRERWEIFQKLRPRDINLCEVVSDSKDDVEFFECSVPTMSGIGNSKSSKLSGSNVRRTPVSLAKIIKEYGGGRKIDFMSIDCEGHDLSVLRSNDWSGNQPTYVVVEDHEGHSNSVHTEIDNFMKSCGYNLIIQLGPSKIFVRE